MEYVLLRHHVTHTRSNTLLFCDLAFLLLQNLGENDKNENLCGADDRATERRQGSPSTEKWGIEKVDQTQKYFTKNKKKKSETIREGNCLQSALLTSSNSLSTNQGPTKSVLPISQDELQGTAGFQLIALLFLLLKQA